MDGAAIDAPTQPNIVFATSTVSTGNLGGLLGADAICNARAQAVPLRGHYVAWLSTSTVNARDRLGAARGWVRPDGLAFVDTVADLLAGKILYVPRIDETGAIISDTTAPTMTGTRPDGTVTAGATCGDWMSASNSQSRGAGLVYAGGGEWTVGWGGTCDQFQRLYCFGIDAQLPITATPVSGRRMFLSTPWMPSGGMSNADTHCNSDATAASLSGSYRAMLATSTTTALERFTLDSRPWVRPDGVRVAAANGLAAQDLDSAPNVTAAGTFVSDWPFTGALSPSAAAADNCTDWSSTSATSTIGYSWRATAGFYSALGGIPCNVARPIYCGEL
jgi:hypothetical protein